MYCTAAEERKCIGGGGTSVVFHQLGLLTVTVDFLTTLFGS